LDGGDDVASWNRHQRHKGWISWVVAPGDGWDAQWDASPDS